MPRLKKQTRHLQLAYARQKRFSKNPVAKANSLNEFDDMIFNGRDTSVKEPNYNIRLENEKAQLADSTAERLAGRNIASEINAILQTEQNNVKQTIPPKDLDYKEYGHSGFIVFRIDHNKPIQLAFESKVHVQVFFNSLNDDGLFSDPNYKNESILSVDANEGKHSGSCIVKQEHTYEGIPSNAEISNNIDGDNKETVLSTVILAGTKVGSTNTRTSYRIRSIKKQPEFIYPSRNVLYSGGNNHERQIETNIHIKHSLKNNIQSKNSSNISDWSSTDCAGKYNDGLDNEADTSTIGVKTDIFKCEKCPATFKTKSGFERHCKRHTDQYDETDSSGNDIDDTGEFDNEKEDDSSTLKVETDILKCEKCSATFRTQSGLKRHYKRHNAEQGGKSEREKVAEQEEEWIDENVLNEYLKKADEYRCRLCSKLFKKLKAFEKHFKTHCEQDVIYTEDVNANAKELLDSIHNNCTEKDQNEVEQNSEIKEISVIKEDINEHEEDKRNISSEVGFFTVKMFKCKKCKKSFRKQGTFFKHVNYHLFREKQESSAEHRMNQKRKLDSLAQNTSENSTPKSKFYAPCFFCDTMFSSYLDRKEHIQEKHEHELTCKFCDKISETVTQHEEHSKSHGPFCIICKQTLENPMQLSGHLRKYHLYDIDAQGNKVIFECSSCIMVFAEKKTFDKHLEFHGRMDQIEKIICDICGKAMQSVAGAKAHAKGHEVDSGTAQKLPCDQCGKIFDNDTALLRHRSHTHVVRMYKCKTCDKAFAKSHHLKRHEYQHFGQGKLYKCEICDKKFSQQYNVTVHMRTHTKERPFKCSKCDATFSHKCSLQGHIKQKHLDSSLDFSESYQDDYFLDPQSSQNLHPSLVNQDDRVLTFQLDNTLQVFSENHQPVMVLSVREPETLVDFL